MLNMFSTSFVLITLSTFSLASSSSSGTGKQRLSCSILPDSIFPVLNYTAVQISSTPSGDSLERSNKLCVEPFNGLILKDVTRDELRNLENFFQAAEDAEVKKFVPLLAKLSGEKKLELQRGITKNKVLKLVCDLQIARIKIAQNDSEHDDLVIETKKLNHNLALEGSSTDTTTSTFSWIRTNADEVLVMKAAEKGLVARSFLDF